MSWREKLSRGGFALSWGEISGAFGDLGMLLPLAVSLITVNGMSTTAVFFGIGAAYILAGLFYRLPIPVQPLKAVATIAIAYGLSSTVVAAAGWWMGLILLLLAVTNAARWIERLFTRPVIRGIQLGLALLLMQSGLALASRPQIVPGGADRVLELSIGTLPMGWLIALPAMLLLVWTLRRKNLPASLVVLGFGVAVAVTLGQTARSLGLIHLGLALPKPAVPAPYDLLQALILLVLPQLPLTLGNAVYATVDTTRSYFGLSTHRVTPRNLLTTMGISQLIAAVFGGVPVCHGSGGVTAHYRMGARSGTAPLIIGALCLFLALFVDGNALPILALIPFPVLGTLLIFVGLQHGWLVKDLKGGEEWFVALLTAGLGFYLHNLAIGFGTGILVDRSIWLLRYLRERFSTLA